MMKNLMLIAILLGGFAVLMTSSPPRHDVPGSIATLLVDGKFTP